MNKNQNLSNESNLEQTDNIFTNIIQGSEIINQTISPNINPSIVQNIEDDKKELKENKNDTIHTQLEEKKCKSNSTPKKTLLNQNQILSDSKLFNDSFKNKNITSNSLVNKSNVESNPNINTPTTKIFNENITNNNNNFDKTKFEKKNKKNKSQFIRNSINVYPEEINKFANEIKNGVLRIKVYKSQIKQRRTAQYNEMDSTKNILFLDNEIKSNIKTENNCEISVFNDKKYKYKLLIKRIAQQLKRKINPPTKGYFYVTIVRTDKYLIKIKKIAKKLKICVHQPTHGFFYNFIEKEKQYKLLIKRIATQLKKRIKLPTCKIIKIYESYRLLIKRIADSLKNSLKKKEIIKKEEKQIPAPLIEEQNNNDNNIIIENNNNDQISKTNDMNIDNNDKNMDDNKMDIEMEHIENNGNKNDAMEHIENSDNKKDVNSTKVIIFEDENGNGYKSLTYSKKDSLSQNIYNDINFTFSKMDVIQEEMPKSVEQKRYCYLNFDNFESNNKNKTEQIEKLDVEHNKIHAKIKKENIENNDRIKTEQINQLEKVEQNKNESSSLSMEIINNVLSDDLKQDINMKENMQIKEICEEKNEILDVNKNVEIKSEYNTHKNDINIIDEKLKSKEEKNIPNKSCNILKDFKFIKSVPSLSKTNKNIFMSLSLFKKGNYLNEGEERRIQNKSHTKNNINLNLNNFNYLNNISNNKLNNNLDNNVNNVIVENNNEMITLSDIEVNNSDFINKFQTFLNQEKIDIIDDFPVSNNKQNISYMQQSNFWYLFVCYILNQNKNLSIYSIIHLLEQYNLWIQDKNEKIFYLIKDKIIEYIEKNYQKEIINQFLFMNKFKDLNQIFEKFEIINGKKDKLYDYKQIKIDNINIINDDKNYQCKCDLCTNDRACFQKVYDLNKNNINIVNDTTISIDKPTPKEYQKICEDNMIKKINYNNLLHSNEAIFLEKLPYKNKNNYFSKSKTIIEEKTNIEHKYISKINNDKNDVLNNSINNSKNNLDKNIDNENTNGNGNDKNENINNNETMNNINGAQTQDDEIIEFNEKNKNYKNISKIKPNTNVDKNIEENDKIKSPENGKKEQILFDIKKDNNSEKNKNWESIIEEKDEKDEESGDEDNRSNKKEKKIKRKKKKKNFTKIQNDKFQENENDEKTQEDKKEEEKSYKKKRKSGNSNIKKKNKSKNVENEEKNELEEMLKEDKIENGNVDVENDTNSKRKKSISPNRKKNKK